MRSRLERRLARWEAAGLVEASQREAILEWERTHGGTRAWAQPVLVIMGAAVTGLGLISIIAANWAHIPSWIKLAGAFTATAGIGAAVWTADRRGAVVWRDGMVVLLQLAVLADIGLLAQIYHLGGSLADALLLWVALVGPATHLGGGRRPRGVWLTVALPVVAHRIVDVTVGPGAGPALLLPAAYLLTMLSAAVYLPATAARTLRGYREAAGTWLALAGIATLFVSEQGGIARHLAGSGLSWTDLWALWVATLLVVAIVLLRRSWPWRVRLLLLGALALFVMQQTPLGLAAPAAGGGAFPSAHGLRTFLAVAAPAAASIATLGLFAAHAALTADRHAYAAATAAIGLRFFGLYLQAAGGLAITGLGLVATGVLILAVSWAWRAMQRRFAPSREAGA